ncbi:hypothetical protein BDZ97DRAFT_853816 [Flammula alnicola]|nr:hypothetical protein BDZ97DRAFT_853816 [Flammula alnicola]
MFTFHPLLSQSFLLCKELATEHPKIRTFLDTLLSPVVPCYALFFFSIYLSPRHDQDQDHTKLKRCSSFPVHIRNSIRSFFSFFSSLLLSSTHDPYTPLYGSFWFHIFIIHRNCLHTIVRRLIYSLLPRHPFRSSSHTHQSPPPFLQSVSSCIFVFYLKPQTQMAMNFRLPILFFRPGFFFVLRSVP